MKIIHITEIRDNVSDCSTQTDDNFDHPQDRVTTMRIEMENATSEQQTQTNQRTSQEIGKKRQSDTRRNLDSFRNRTNEHYGNHKHRKKHTFRRHSTDITHTTDYADNDKPAEIYVDTNYKHYNTTIRRTETDYS